MCNKSNIISEKEGNTTINMHIRANMNKSIERRPKNTYSILKNTIGILKNKRFDVESDLNDYSPNHKKI